MTKPLDISSKLKELRLKKKLSAKETVLELKNRYGISISDKTLYGYENGISNTNADTFVALCKIYGVDNILTEFGYDGYDENGKLMPNYYETQMVEKYRTLDPHGKDLVDTVLDKEHGRCIEPKGEEGQNSIVLPFPLMPASAGTGQYLDSNEEGTLEVKDTPEALMADFVLRVSGKSMEPLYSNGDILLIQKRSELKTGDIGVFIINNEGYIKRLGKEGLDSINPDYDGVPVGDHDAFRTVGKVLGKAEIV